MTKRAHEQISGAKRHTVPAPTKESTTKRLKKGTGSSWKPLHPGPDDSHIHKRLLTFDHLLTSVTEAARRDIPLSRVPEHAIDFYFTDTMGIVPKPKSWAPEADYCTQCNTFGLRCAKASGGAKCMNYKYVKQSGCPGFCWCCATEETREDREVTGPPVRTEERLKRPGLSKRW